ncbi:hypothetical protein [Dyadobacter sp. CY356]|uniref:hypothetical protein n=1 Tax=Dyadobacter sp. CY356 TaxID=2906442 RepID=UPI001F1943AD|nr:hypothetical protein [Dyadobacter sp. CY356]MCF0058041.1 hypothetical protein [Dyadobacter sp. CY356]
METLIIEIQDPKARRLIDDLVALGLISVKPSKPSWVERWKDLSNSLPSSTDISEQEILDEIAQVREKRQAS